MTLTKPSKRAGGRFAERNALAYDEVTPGDPKIAANNHISKRRKTTKGLEIVFDPKAHKDYVTGFHKRKVARRKEALGKAAKAERAQRIEDRADKRAAQRVKLHLERYETASDSSDGEQGPAALSGPEVLAVYESGGVTTTVTAVAMNSDSEAEEGAAGELDRDSDGEDVEAGGAPGAAGKRSVYAAPPVVVKKAQHKHKKIKVGHKQKSGKKKMKKADKPLGRTTKGR